ncbi:primosomal protein N' [Bacillus sp. Soil745]|uniref:primosomal protein N' n=1 Tax=Peribacillus TaxID=2675229 RepID=UPI0007107790|nr:primosomal protein N' [Peribacillus frigoritolerans]KRF50389.1 primosomal protein N' [Bacillus sp. Soil745]MCD1160336.1 primosomal protein N' [Peribacillus castrilensis]MCU6599870.1 primosomal protein N' [Peribacillus frigoritolerans]MEB2489688.1 primosomal protein N' [Peribacillus frigoritolerans]MED4696067.1 primosomal protein N' [Peribacillus frigoritolerans]
MDIASVIVDVPAKQTDREFDYRIPEKWNQVIKPGMRVIVPFGPRMVQGFVTGLKAKSDFAKLRFIKEPMDLEPIINDELLQLGDWLTKEAMCFKISALQAMLPAAMKAKYEKVIKVVEDKKDQLPPSIQNLFGKNDSLSWKDVIEGENASLVQKEMQNGNLELEYNVKNRLNKKTVRVIKSLLSPMELKEMASAISSHAKKQQELLQYFIEHQEPIPLKELLELMNTSSGTVKSLVSKGALAEMDQEVYRDPYENRVFEKSIPFTLTAEQTAALKPIQEKIHHDEHDVFLLYGVTGSGKTEVYLQAIASVIEKGKEAIMLVPEISLTPQTVKRFKERFGEQVAVMHSGLSVGEKYDEWRKIHRKEVKVVVGARSAVFAPFESLGLVIIDEEHESSYKQEETPRYHARDVAIERAKSYGCPVILGSATPTLESFARAKKNVYKLLTLSQRMNKNALPAVDIVDMREELRTGNRSMFSELLFTKLKDRLEKGEQTVLMLNKRGHSSFVMCRSCGLVINCPNCDISLTYHRFNDIMKCHYCGFEEGMPSVCPECESEHIRFFGTGTQKVEEELAKILPEARVIRMDVDTTSKKGSHERLLNAFGEGKADILLGTQMIAKGLDFPNITLVGVLSADTMLHLPDFRSSEKTFQLLTQVSGRAGRHQLPGEVVIQTYTPEHYSIELSALQDYDAFYEREMYLRRQSHYPPYYYVVLITVSHEDLMKTVSVTEKITNYLGSRLNRDSVVLGPVASPISRINNRYRYQCLIKYKREPDLNQHLRTLLEHYQKETAQNHLQISIDLNPQIMM